MFGDYRYHVVFTDSPQPMLDAKTPTAITGSSSRSSPTSGTLRWRTHPRGTQRERRWMVCAAIAHNLTRAAGVLVSTFPARV
jgi:hypothetical protein